MERIEFDALPDVTPGFGQVEKIINGKRVKVPFAEVPLKTLWDSSFVFVDGEHWMIGMRDGVRVKSRML